MIPKKPDYYGHIHPWVMSAIQEVQPVVVLDVGCGEGRLGEHIKHLIPGTIVHGVEINEAAASIARTRLDSVVCGSIEAQSTLDALTFAEEGVDLIMFVDVLEHLVDPGAALRNLRKCLVPQWGQILSVIPNVQHHSVIDMLLRGDWEYTNEGLLDETHLRFFTRKSIERLFRDNGYIPSLWDTAANKPTPIPFKNSLEEVFGFDVNLDDLDVYQYIFLGKQT